MADSRQRAKWEWTFCQDQENNFTVLLFWMAWIWCRNRSCCKAFRTLLVSYCSSFRLSQYQSLYFKNKCVWMLWEFSVPQIEYPLGGSSNKGNHVYFFLQDFWVILLFCQIVLFDINVVLMLEWWLGVTIVQSDITIVAPWQLSTGSIHDYCFATAP